MCCSAARLGFHALQPAPQLLLRKYYIKLADAGVTLTAAHDFIKQQQHRDPAQLPAEVPNGPQMTPQPACIHARFGGRLAMSL